MNALEPRGFGRENQRSLRGLQVPVTLSVIVPAYNEQNTIATILHELIALRTPPHEIIVVDDGSTDRTVERVKQVALQDPRIHLLRLEQNQGKGAAIRAGLPIVTGNVVAIQDADLEYHPDDLVHLSRLFENQAIHAVYGSRWLNPGNTRPPWPYSVGGNLLSKLTNVLYGSRLTDEATGYKLIRTDILRSLQLKSTGFDFCPEVTARLLRRGRRIVEIPIRYLPRDKTKGKKITWLDGLQAVWTLFTIRFQRTKS